MAEQLDQLLKAIDDVGETVHAKYDEMKVKYQRLESEFEHMQQKNATAGMGGSNNTKDFSLQADVAKALNEPQASEAIKSFIAGSRKSISIETKDMSLTGNYLGGTAGITGTPTRIIPTPGRAMHVRDLLPKIVMDGASLPVIKENGTVGSFLPVAEGALKPTLDFTLSEAPARAEVIAAVTVVTKSFLDDLGPRGVVSWLQSRLTELYLIAESDQLLNGNGVSPNLNGLNNTGNFTAAAGAATNDVEKLIRAIVQMRAAGRKASVIVINPNDLPNLLLNVASGSGEFNLPSFVNVNEAGGISIMNTPVIDTVSQAEGTFNVLDTSGMLMGIRSPLKIEFFEQDADNVKTNKVSVRTEARIAFANYSALNNIKGAF